MSWRFRKSFTVIPGLRLNLSKSGLSASIGAAPFTLNVSPEGLAGTVSIPGLGVSHREKLLFEHDVEKHITLNHGHHTPTGLPLPVPAEPNGPVQHVHSASTERMTSVRLAEVKTLIQTAYRQHAEVEQELDTARTAKVDAEATFDRWNRGFLFKRIRPMRFVAIKEQADTEAARVDELEQQLQLSKIGTHIDIEPQQAELFYQMRDAFAGLSECAAIWDVKTKQATDRFHDRTTADERISRERVRFNLGDCDLIAWTQKVPHVANAKGGDLYLYPGFILFRAAKQAFSLIDYHDVVVMPGIMQFQEESNVPSDARVVGQTWFKANKDGSRDKRFNGNYQIPIARYGALCLKSGDGLWEEFHLSNPDKMFLFIASLELFTKSFVALPTIPT